MRALWRIRQSALAGGALLDIGVYPLNFASMVFGNDIAKISTAAVLADTGVDGITTAVLTYRDGRVAVTHADFQAASNREGLFTEKKAI